LDFAAEVDLLVVLLAVLLFGRASFFHFKRAQAQMVERLQFDGANLCFGGSILQLLARLEKRADFGPVAATPSNRWAWLLSVAICWLVALANLREHRPAKLVLIGLGRPEF
jgi:hypothetical protein